MAIALTWKNVFVMAGLIASLISMSFGGTAAMIQWRFDALQHQLNERMTLYQREIQAIDGRLGRLENDRAGR